MLNKNKLLVFLLVVSLTFLFSFSGLAAEYNIKIGNIYTSDHPIGLGIEKFAEVLEDETDGKVAVETYHDSTLGGEREMAEEVRMGTLEMLVSGLGGIGHFVPGIAVLELPYMYEDMQHLKRVTNELKPEIIEIFQEKGFRPVGYFYLGPRSIASVKPLRNLEDVKGLKFRVPEAPMYIGMAKALGAKATPVAYNEVYTALQTGVAEAMEGSPDSVYLNKFYEVADNYNLTKHIYQVMYLVINEDKYNEFSEDVKEAIQKAGKISSEYEIEQVQDLNQKYINKMKEEGTQIIEIENRAPFEEAVSSFREEFAKDKGEKAYELYEKAKEIE